MFARILKREPRRSCIEQTEHEGYLVLPGNALRVDDCRVEACKGEVE